MGTNALLQANNPISPLRPGQMAATSKGVPPVYISIVEIDLPAGTDCVALKDAFKTTAQHYVVIPGLLRKYYTLQDGTMTGGVFVWDTLENAKAGHADPGWRKIIADRYGNEPRVSYYEVPTIVDNVIGAVLQDEEYLRACAKERKLA